MAKLVRCDRCGVTQQVNEHGYVQDWETVTVSTNYHYDLCAPCGKLLFLFFEKAEV